MVILNLAKNVALGLVTLSMGGGAVALVRAGYALKAWRYKKKRRGWCKYI
ncbi:hypothetical protein [uncultured Gammaproteobacteria bacterium]|jgi:hypothetical protein|nr:hypothetical protein [uncultured Gammaproteobacteria bacterium]CAC9492740.1 hypothetical protein [uncultured Gammaproteobacteria bacterium]